MSEITSAIIDAFANNPSFCALADSIRASFRNAAANETVLFTTDAENLYDLILENIPEEVRQSHRCSACKRFVNRFGGLVAINDEGDIHPVMWDDAPEYYAEAVKAITRAIRKAKITGVFVTIADHLGNAESGGWKHLSVEMPAHLIYKGRLYKAGQHAAAIAEEHRMLCENIGRYHIETVATALSLLRSNSLYRSEKVLGVAEWFYDILENIRNSHKSSGYLWKKAACAPAGFCHINGSMIGTLLDDIEAGHSFDTVKAKFDAKMDPLKYQRPQAAPTAGNIARAEEIFAKLGLGDSLQRRFARLDEIEKIWQPAAEAPAKRDGLFADLLPQAKKSVVENIRARISGTITWEKFQRTVLPKAKKIRYYVDGARRYYCAYVTAAVADSAPILQWDREEKRNPFSWYFYHNGSVPFEWNLSTGWVDVTAISLKPSMWNGGFEHQDAGVLFVLDGAKDTRYKNSGSAIFPENLKRELHEVRSTIEAYSAKHALTGYEEASACGIFLSNGQKTSIRILVTDDLGVNTEYTIDRWD